jgi:hypothetical protein
MSAPDWLVDRERTEAFVYLTELPVELFSALFDRLYLPREEWRRRLRIGRRDFDRFASGGMGKLAAPLRVYIDPVTRKKCFHGADIRAALRACVE